MGLDGQTDTHLDSLTNIKVLFGQLDTQLLSTKF